MLFRSRPGFPVTIPVLLRVGGIFTATTISLSLSPRQRSTRYTIRAGRNLPDKEFRYLRTVIVTADIHGDLGSELRPYGLTTYRNLSALVTCHSVYVVLTTWHRAVFLLNSRRTHFTAARLLIIGRLFFRSYEAILPSSFTVVLSRALEYSSRLPVSVCGTGTLVYPPAFLGSSFDGLRQLLTAISDDHRLCRLRTCFLGG